MRSRPVLAALLLLMAATPYAHGQPPMATLHEVLSLSADGSAAIHLSATWPAGTDQLRIPVVGAEPRNVVVTSTGVATVAPRWDPTREQLVLTTTAVPSAASLVEVTYTDDGAASRETGGSLRLRREFVNTTEVPIEQYSMTVELPDGYVFSDVRARDAADKETNAGLGASGARRTATIGGRLAPAGGRVMLDAHAQKRGTALPLSVLLTALSIGYLYRFRDLAARRPS